MVIIRCMLVLAVAAWSAAGAASGAEPSEACRNGEVTPSTTPAGIGVRQAGDPYQETTSLYLCSTGAAPGAVWVRGDTPNGRAHVIVDGDSTNTLTPCSDGYVATRVDTGGGTRFYRGDDGDFSFIATERSLEHVVLGLAACVIPDVP